MAIRYSGEFNIDRILVSDDRIVRRAHNVHRQCRSWMTKWVGPTLARFRVLHHASEDIIDVAINFFDSSRSNTREGRQSGRDP